MTETPKHGDGPREPVMGGDPMRWFDEAPELERSYLWTVRQVRDVVNRETYHLATCGDAEGRMAYGVHPADKAAALASAGREYRALYDPGLEPGEVTGRHYPEGRPRNE